MSELRRHPTGVSGLDRMLHGGLPEGSWVLVLGPPGAGKSILARQFLYSSVSSQFGATVLSTAEPRDMILQAMWSFGWRDFLERIQVLDAHSWRRGNPAALDLRRLTEVSIAVTSFFEENAQKNHAFVIDSLTDILLNNEPESAIRLVSQLKARLQPKNVTTLLLMEEGPHPNSVITTLEYITDGTIRLKFDEVRRHITINRMISTPLQLSWSEFTIQKGIDLVVSGSFGSDDN